ncbi:tellurite resistance protein [Metapseudomonas resinovorans]|uniref:class I SAM-dependent methyltransferase n=1 Tax=Metapseudomonas resinovorans TaxID=53412 RepID=UPI0009871FFE|nr:class I SAM-dependent methyltransferase [Pseudomonas resinovorans]GLZ84611.1 tellurite resistance protein [Pseudomonas resinovorans]
MSFTDFYNATEGQPARVTLRTALECWDGPPGHALDLGCGAGRDTLELLRRGWQVLAVDAEPEALARLEAQVDEEKRQRLQSRCCRFETMPLPAAQLVNSSFALPLCPPEAFPSLWQAICGALPTGGLFAGHLFGERDDWANNGITILRRRQLEELLSGWDVLMLEEKEEDGVTAKGRNKHWHLFSVVARRL